MCKDTIRICPVCVDVVENWSECTLFKEYKVENKSPGMIPSNYTWMKKHSVFTWNPYMLTDDNGYTFIILIQRCGECANIDPKSVTVSVKKIFDKIESSTKQYVGLFSLTFSNEGPAIDTWYKKTIDVPTMTKPKNNTDLDASSTQDESGETETEDSDDDDEEDENVHTKPQTTAPPVGTRQPSFQPARKHDQASAPAQATTKSK